MPVPAPLTRLVVHAPQVLDEEVLAVEVVGAGVAVAALVAAPQVEAEVLGVDVALPFVLGAEGGRAAVGGQRAGEVGAAACAGRGAGEARGRAGLGVAAEGGGGEAAGAGGDGGRGAFGDFARVRVGRADGGGVFALAAAGLDRGWEVEF